MAIRITAIRLSGGSSHQHIVRLWWTNPASGKTDDNTRLEIVQWIEDKNGKAFVQDAQGHRADVGVVKPAHGEKYLRTYADGRWTDNLLALPRRQFRAPMGPASRSRRGTLSFSLQTLTQPVIEQARIDDSS